MKIVALLLLTVSLSAQTSRPGSIVTTNSSATNTFAGPVHVLGATNVLSLANDLYVDQWCTTAGVYTDGTCITNALNQLATQGGGRAIIRAGVAISTPSTPIILGSTNGLPVELVIQQGGQLVVNVNSASSAAISIGPGSSLVCPASPNYALTAQTSRVPEIIPGGSLNVKYLVTNLIKDGTQNFAKVSGCYFANPGLASSGVTTAVLEFAGLDQFSFVEHNYIEAYNGVSLIRLDPSTTGNGSDGFVLYENHANCSGVVTCTPLLIQGSGGFAPGFVNLIGGIYAHCENAVHCAEIDIEGDGSTTAGSPHGIGLFGTYLEGIHSTDIGILCNGCIELFGKVTVAGTGGNVLQINNLSTSLTNNIRMSAIGVTLGGNWTNAVVDSQNSATLTFASLQVGSTGTGVTDYYTPDVQSYLANLNLPIAITAVGTKPTLAGTGACATITTQVGGSWSGSFKCTGSTGASTVTITPAQAATNGWSCSSSDVTTTVIGSQSGTTTAHCVMTYSSVTANDVLTFTATRY